MIISTLQPLADDAVLVDLGRMLADQYAALGAKSPALCHAYASGIGATGNIEQELAASFGNRETEINRRIVETAKQRQDISATVVSELRKKLDARIAAPAAVPTN